MTLQSPPPLPVSWLIQWSAYADESDYENDDPEEGETAFMSSYSDALSGELKATTLEKSFIRASEPSFKKDEVSSTQLHVLHE